MIRQIATRKTLLVLSKDLANKKYTNSYTRRPYMLHSKIKVDLSLSSFNHPRLTSSSVIGSCSLNVTGFLDLLETRLGVNSNSVSFTTRLVDYLYCLERTENPEAFYKFSYQKDPFAVARKLLLWRDELYMSGWTGSFKIKNNLSKRCLLYTSPSPRDRTRSRMPSSA